MTEQGVEQIERGARGVQEDEPSGRRERRVLRSGPRRGTAASFVQDELRRAILAMQIVPGAALVEKDLDA